MSVLVKSMERPKNCLWCPLQYNGFCQITKTDVNSDLGKKADDCPLVELPEKHGRLIDADKLKLEYPHNSDWEYPVTTNSEACETIDKQPTVIDAEDEG